jgi:hypothetical protein
VLPVRSRRGNAAGGDDGFKFLTNFFLIRVTMDNKEAARKRMQVVFLLLKENGRRMVARDTAHPPPPRTFHPFSNLFGMKSNKQLAEGLACAHNNPTGRNVAVGVVRPTAVCAAPASAAAKKPCLP